MEGMSEFFHQLRREGDLHPAHVAGSYAWFLWSETHSAGTYEPDEDKLQSFVGASRFNIAMASNKRDMVDLTRRGVLISDSLLLAMDDVGTGDFESHVYLGRTDNQRWLGGRRVIFDELCMSCSDPEFIGQWVLDAEDLLRQGLALHLPSYLVRWAVPEYLRGRAGDTVSSEFERLAARIGRHRVTTWLGDVDPLLNYLVRPILRIDLPFVAGVSLRDFGRITVHELGSYEAFRDFLRSRFLDLDAACEAEQMNRALAKVGLEISDGIRSVSAELNRIRSRRAVTMTGAAISSAAATLVAVYGPALAPVVAVLGASGGVWGAINAIAENRNQRSIQQTSPWYYVWVLAQQKHRRIRS